MELPAPSTNVFDLAEFLRERAIDVRLGSACGSGSVRLGYPWIDLVPDPTSVQFRSERFSPPICCGCSLALSPANRFTFCTIAAKKASVGVLPSTARPSLPGSTTIPRGRCAFWMYPRPLGNGSQTKQLSRNHPPAGVAMDKTALESPSLVP